MSDLISRQAAIDVAKQHWYNADNPDWLRDDGSPVFLTCSECHETVVNNGSAPTAEQI